MSRQRRIAIGAGVAGLALLLFATGAKAQETEPDANGGGYGKLPPVGPPEDRRDKPKTPGDRAGKRKRPSGNNIIPTLLEPGGDCTPAGGVFSATYADGDLTDEIQQEGANVLADSRGEPLPFGGFGLPELGEGTLQVFLPAYDMNNEQETNLRVELQELITDWACVFGYDAVVFVEETPENRAYTARAWYRGNILGEYDLEQSFEPAYLNTVDPALELPHFFAFGLAHWLHGPQ